VARATGAEVVYIGKNAAEAGGHVKTQCDNLGSNLRPAYKSELEIRIDTFMSSGKGQEN
jgi:hypothetical protein